MSSAADLVKLFQKKQNKSNQFDRIHYTQVLQSEYDSHLFAGDISIKGSQKMQCIAFHPDGTVETRRDI